MKALRSLSKLSDRVSIVIHFALLLTLGALLMRFSCDSYFCLTHLTQYRYRSVLTIAQTRSKHFCLVASSDIFPGHRYLDAKNIFPMISLLGNAYDRGPSEIITRKNVDISNIKVACKCDKPKFSQMEWISACYTSTTLIIILLLQ